MADITCACGHAFNESLGKYGCPNCEGAKAPTSTSRVQKLRQERREAGLVRVELYVPRSRASEVRAKVADLLAGPAPRTDYENSCPVCGPVCSC
jgi:hypothetical protein